VRRALGWEAVRLACGQTALQELDELAADLKRLAAAKAMSPARFVERSRNTDSRLHDLIANSCGNQFLANELNRLKTLFRAFRDVSYTQDQARNDLRRLAREALEHLAIVEALQAGDRRSALRAMTRHLQGGVRYWARVLPDSVDGAAPKRQNSRFQRNGASRNGAAR